MSSPVMELLKYARKAGSPLSSEIANLVLKYASTPLEREDAKTDASCYIEISSDELKSLTSPEKYKFESSTESVNVKLD